jgi:hypothetical protein
MRGTHLLERTDGWTSEDMKESKWARGTHILEIAERGTIKTWKEIGRAKGTHILGNGRETVGTQTKSEYVRGHSLPEEVNVWDKSGHRRNGVNEGHSLAGGGREMSQDMERKRANVGHSRTGEGRGTDKSGHRKKASERGLLTNWREKMEGDVMTPKESD